MTPPNPGRRRVSLRRVSFDTIARPYRWMEYASFGRLLERCRFRQLGEVTNVQRALVFGDGDGRFLARLLIANPHVEVDAVDGSAAMLALTAGRIGQQSRVRLHHADALAFAPSGHYDLIVTHFFLDCLTSAEIETLLKRIEPHLRPGARWLLSEFAVPHRQPAAWLARLLIALLYRAFGVLTGLRTRTMPDYPMLFERAGWFPELRHTFLGGILVSELWRIDDRE